MLSTSLLAANVCACARRVRDAGTPEYDTVACPRCVTNGRENFGVGLKDTKRKKSEAHSHFE